MIFKNKKVILCVFCALIPCIRIFAVNYTAKDKDFCQNIVYISYQMETSTARFMEHLNSITESTDITKEQAIAYYSKFGKFYKSSDSYKRQITENIRRCANPSLFLHL